MKPQAESLRSNDDGVSETQDPLIEHVYLGNRVVASITGAGDACFIATIAYGTPLASDLNVFRAFRDRVLRRLVFGHAAVKYYYEAGPGWSKWLKRHEAARGATYLGLVVLAVPMKALLFGRAAWLVIIGVSSLGLLLLMRRKGWKWTTALVTAFAVAFAFVIVYSFVVDVPTAMASYVENDKFYYTVDHIGRPFNLRDDDLDLRWWERHEPFGTTLSSDSPGQIYAGAGDYQWAWQPGFQFPGQYLTLGPNYFINNHFRTYAPILGRYMSNDPVKIEDLLLPNPVVPQYMIYDNHYVWGDLPFNTYLLNYAITHPSSSNYYNYSTLNPVLYYDPTGEIFPPVLILPVTIGVLFLIIWGDVIWPIMEASEGKEPEEAKPHVPDEPDKGLPPKDNRPPDRSEKKCNKNPNPTGPSPTPPRRFPIPGGGRGWRSGK